MNTKSIALSLGLSGKTVDGHRRNLMEKLGLHSVAELTRLAVRQGLVSSAD
jgi:DNA-binding CsgD family transcriptional regulator